MKISKRLLSMLLAFTLIVPLFVFMTPAKAHAAFTLDTGYGKITATCLDNDYLNGKYRIRYKFSYTDLPYDWYFVNIKNIKLVNSSGKTIYTWSDIKILEGGGTVEKNFSCDFSTLPSDTYYFKYTLSCSNESGKTVSRQREISHVAGSVSYKTGKYITNTDGTKSLYVEFSLKMLKDKTPKLEIYDSNNKLVYTYTSKKALSSNSSSMSWTWNMLNKNNGLPISDGTYKFKVTCGGKSAIKSINIKYPN